MHTQIFRLSRNSHSLLDDPCCFFLFFFCFFGGGVGRGEGREDPNKYHYKRAIVDPPAKCHLNVAGVPIMVKS